MPKLNSLLENFTQWKESKNALRIADFLLLMIQIPLCKWLKWNQTILPVVLQTRNICIEKTQISHKVGRINHPIQKSLQENPTKVQKKNHLTATCKLQACNPERTLIFHKEYHLSKSQ